MDNARPGHAAISANWLSDGRVEISGGYGLLPIKGFISFDCFGCRVTSFLAPDRNGRMSDVVLGPLNSGDARADQHFMGALIGRFAGRIADASFSIDGIEFGLTPNDGENLLHGGRDNFSNRYWSINDSETAESRRIRFNLTSPSGDQGFPGEIEAIATYTWEEAKSLRLDIEARSSQPTPFNMTQHIYWNLGGPGERDVRSHLLQINAGQFLPIRGDSVPTGELRPVAHTLFDFRIPRPVGSCLDSRDEQIEIAHGIDHCWALDGGGFREVATLAHPASGRKMAVLTDQAGLQVYTANHFGGGPTGKGGALYGRYAGIALETQAFPNAPNQPGFPDTILRPGMTYRSRSLFAFS